MAGKSCALSLSVAAYGGICYNSANRDSQTLPVRCAVRGEILNKSMKKKILVVAIGAIALLVMVAAIEIVQSGRWRGGAMFVAVALPIVILFARPKPVKGIEELDDDDGGIDWHEENVRGEVVNVCDGWIVLLNDAPVHEAKAVAEQLESAHIRCRLKLLKEDRALHVYGDGVYGDYGMGTRMCVLVEPSDYVLAKKITEQGQ